MVRRSHYEIAFEHYLDRRGTPYVSVEDVRHHMKGSIGAKSFDYIVYPPAGPACLVDVKGRKTPALRGDQDCRQKTWVTEADVRDLAGWQKIFGAGFAAMFAFGYWLADETTGGGPGQRIDEKEMFTLAGRRYSFWLVDVNEYARHQRPLSRSWKTVSVPRGVFQKISRRMESCWSAAPC